MLIMVTNDDGIHSAGLGTLAQALMPLGDVVVVAPDRERSAIGHALTLHAPLRAEELRAGWFAVSGTPTDCVNLGIHGLLKERPDVIVSGINRGSNMGDDITYSGTVSAAMEGTLMGVPSMAVSLAGPSFATDAFEYAARIAAEICERLHARGLPSDTFLNVNVPAGVPRGIALTRQGKRLYQDAVVEKTDPRGRRYYWIGGGDPGFLDEEGSDVKAVNDGLVSITPLHLDLTNYRSFEALASWGLEGLEALAPAPSEQTTK